KEEKALVDSLILAMKQKFGEDQKRIAHALMVLERAQEIMIKEGGEPRVVLAAAVLHDIGIHEAERKYNSTAARYHQEEGPPVAREILSTLGAGEALIDEVCDIVGHHHHPRDEETLSFKIVYDADLIVNLEEHQKDREIEREKLSEIIEKKMLTDSGKRLASEALFGQER
ncbi:MAG: HD domain-containing protein, partial [Desulfobacteraceae bacterium]|nr:HD domain-containing protein [Desulfobacteraceae bacterium]